MNKKIYRVGKVVNSGCLYNATTNTDLTDKDITPLRGFPHYEAVKNDFFMDNGCVIRPKKRILMFKLSLMLLILFRLLK